MTDRSSSGGPELTLLKDLIEELVRDAQEAYQARKTGQPRGPRTGFPTLDDELGEFLAPGIHLLQAAPGAGKTAFLLQAGGNCGFPCLFVTAELPRKELFRRIICRVTRTDLRKLKTGELDPSLVKDLATKAVNSVPRMAILDSTVEFARKERIQQAAQALCNHFQTTSLLVVVDSLHFWVRGCGTDSTEYERIAVGLEALKTLSVELSCPVLCAIQRNRQGQRTGGMHSGKGNGDLEYEADSLMELTPEENRLRDLVPQTIVLKIHKNRNGESGAEIPLEFHGAFMEFREH